MLSTRKARAGAAVLAATVVAGGIALGVGPASADVTTMTITGVSPHLVAATTAKQVITLTGTNFNEDDITGITIVGCTTAPSYIVASPTSIVLKTAADCAASTGGGALVTITGVGGTQTTTTATATKLDFIAPPTIVTLVANAGTTAGTYPVMTLSTAGRTAFDQVRNAPVSGGTTIKVIAGANQFGQSTAFPLAASLGGVALTGVKAYTTAGVLVTSGAADYFTGVVGAHAATTGGTALSVTSNGVTKTFAGAATGFNYAGSVITVVPATGPSDGGNTIKVNAPSGTPFQLSTGTTPTTVDFVCGGVATAGTVVGTGSTTSSLNVTVPAFPDAAATATGPADGPCTVRATTGTTDVSVNSAGSTYTYSAVS